MARNDGRNKVNPAASNGQSTALVPTSSEDAERALAEELSARAKEEGIDLVGPEGLLTRVTKNVLEAALGAELTEHLGYEAHDPAGRGSGNSRNGTTCKVVHTDVDPVTLDVPRDRDGIFSPVIVPNTRGASTASTRRSSRSMPKGSPPERSSPTSTRSMGQKSRRTRSVASPTPSTPRSSSGGTVRSILSIPSSSSTPSW